MFSIQNSHATTFQHKRLTYILCLACGKLNINIPSPRARGCKGQTKAYNEYVRNAKYWTIYIPGNHITKMPAILWDQVKMEYSVKPFYQQTLSHIRFTVEHYYNAIRFTVSNKNTAARFFAHHCVYKSNAVDGIIDGLVDNLCT